MTSVLAAPRTVIGTTRHGGRAGHGRKPMMRPVQIEYWGGPFDGRVDQVLSGMHGQPPAWCTLTFQPSRSALDTGPNPPGEDHRYVRMDDTPRPPRPWRYRWEGGAGT